MRGTTDLIERYKSNWDWGRLSWSMPQPLNLELIGLFEDNWIFYERWASHQKLAAHSSLEIIECFGHHSISFYSHLPWHLLKSSEIDEVISDIGSSHQVELF